MSNTSAGPLQCTASVAVPPTLRAEGMTDLIGDIVLTCTGGLPLTTGNAVPTVNVTVSLGTNVTSRLLGSNSLSLTTNPSNTSEALLLLDEPGSVGQGAATSLTVSPNPAIGASAAQNLCKDAALGAAGTTCAVSVATTTCNNPNNAACATLGAAPISYLTSGGVVGPNMFAGLVSGNQVTFQGIPVLPPATTGLARVFRITNVRANISGLSAGLAGTTPLTASIAISGSTSVPVTNPVLTAGFIQSGLSTGVKNKNVGSLSTANRTFPQCTSVPSSGSTPQPLVVLQYTKNFGTAFKIRVQPTQAPSTPGTIYNSESGFIPSATYATGSGIAGSTTVGLADYGTRLKAVFNNVPSGVRLFVSTGSLAGNGGLGNQPVGPNANTSFATLVSTTVGSEMTPDTGTNPIVTPVVPPTTSVNGSTGTTLAELPVINNTAEAVWEVTATNPAALDTLNFGVWQVFSANPTNNSPALGTGTVSLSYAPTPTQGAFTTAAGTVASATLGIPRFADTSTATNFLTISVCQTDLLFPFVTNQAGFDTGLAIANTTADPFSGTVGGTASAQAGACTLNWYQGSNNPAATNTGTIASGTVYTTLASTAAPGFQGYMIAVCNFQYAHGFAFISDLGARNLAMGYLANILGSNSDGTNPRGNTTAEYSSH